MNKDTFLKVKVKSLAEEARIIRKEETNIKNLPKQYRDRSADATLTSLTLHRKDNVRNEARATQLARAYLKGKAYSLIEHKCTDNYRFSYYIVPRILSMVVKYGDNKKTTREDILNCGPAQQISDHKESLLERGTLFRSQT